MDLQIVHTSNNTYIKRIAQVLSSLISWSSLQAFYTDDLREAAENL